MAMGFIVLLAVIGAAAAAIDADVVAQTRTIYRCETPQGHVEFTDRGCKGQAKRAQRSEQGVRTVGFKPLTPSEKQQLQLLDTPKPRRASDRQRLEQLRADQQERCGDWRRDLKQLRDLRRRGYRLSEADNLDRQQDKLKRLLRQSC